jgi:hypothetical protein
MKAEGCNPKAAHAFQEVDLRSANAIDVTLQSLRWKVRSIASIAGCLVFWAVSLMSPAAMSQSLDAYEHCRLWRAREVVNVSGSPDTVPPAACPRVWHLQLTGGGSYYLGERRVQESSAEFPELPTAGVFLDTSFGFLLHRPRSVDKPRTEDRRRFQVNASLFYRPGVRVQAHYARLANLPDAVVAPDLGSQYRTLEVLQSRHLFAVQLGRGYQGTLTVGLGGFIGAHFRAKSRTNWTPPESWSLPPQSEPVDYLFWIGRERLAAGVTAELSINLLSFGTVRMGLNVSADYYVTDQNQWTGTVGPLLQYFPFRRTPPQLRGLGPEPPPIDECPHGLSRAGSRCVATP